MLSKKLILFIIFPLLVLIVTLPSHTFAANPNAACGVAVGPGSCYFIEDAGGVAQCSAVCNSDNVAGTVTCPSCHNSITCYAADLCGSHNNYGHIEGCLTYPDTVGCRTTGHYCSNGGICCVITPTPTEAPTRPESPPTSTPTPKPKKTPTPTIKPSPTMCVAPKPVTNITVTCPYCQGVSPTITPNANNQ